MNLTDKLSQAEADAKGWVLSHYHSFWGGVVIGVVVGWLLHAL